MRWGYTFAYWMLALTWLGIAAGGPFAWMGFFLGFFLLPVIEYLFPVRLGSEVGGGWYFDLLVWLAFPLMTIFLVYSAVAVGAYQSRLELTGALVSAGMMSGILAINVGHELVHRREKWQRALGVGLLSLVNYAHYGILHVFGHHKNVATPVDPATARFGENLYTFWIRHYTRGLIESFNFEARRLKSKGRSWIFNRVLLYWCGHLALMAALYFWLGSSGLLFWLGQSVVATCLLMDVDYIEHYGLVRKQGPDGQYQGVQAEHSWDSDSAWTNFMLLNLGLHSHHHLRANLPYPELRPQAEAKKLPYGYTVMLLAAFFPFWYRSIIHPRLLPQNSSIHDLKDAL